MAIAGGAACSWRQIQETTNISPLRPKIYFFLWITVSYRLLGDFIFKVSYVPYPLPPLTAFISLSLITNTPTGKEPPSLGIHTSFLIVLTSKIKHPHVFWAYIHTSSLNIRVHTPLTLLNTLTHSDAQKHAHSFQKHAHTHPF